MKPTINIGTSYIFHEGHVVAYPGGKELPTSVFLMDLAAALREREALDHAIKNMENALAREFKE